MSSAVVPQWKINLQQKLDKKKDDERRKLLEEEQRRLAALPPWKRMGMVPTNVIIISGGTKTVSNLSTDSTTDDVKQEDKSAKAVKSSFVGSSATVSSTSDRRTNVTTAKQSIAVNSVNDTDSKLTNHVGEDEMDGGKTGVVAGQEGVDVKHVSSVSDNPFFKLGGGRRRKLSPASTSRDTVTKGTESTLETTDHQIKSSEKIIENKTTDSLNDVNKEPDDSIRQRSQSASPRRAAKERNVDLKIEENDFLPEVRLRKNSVSDLRSRFGRAASIDDLKVVSRKMSESEDGTPVMSPRSPPAILDRSKLFDDQLHKVHINLNPDSSKRLSTTAPSKASTKSKSTVVSDDSPSTESESQTQKPSLVKYDTPSTQSETKPASVTQTKVVSPTTNGVGTKQQAPKPPTSDTSSSTKKDIAPAKPVVTSSTTNSTNQSAEKAIKTDSLKSNKPAESSNSVNKTNHESLPDQPKTAVLGDGQSSLRRKKGLGKISASALISLSSDSSKDVQLSEHNARVRDARQEARASGSNLLRSARDIESKDTDSIPRGVVSTNAFGSKVKAPENHVTTTTSKDDTPHVDSIPYPSNFRQPKKESTYVDTIPYPENFRQLKSNSGQDTPEPKVPSVKLVTNSKTTTVDDIPRTNIDDVVLMPIKENVPLDTTLVNGSVEEKAPPRKIKKRLEVQWIGLNTPTGTPSALKSQNGEGKKMNITFNESSLSETFEYQSESSLLHEYLREERGMNGNPRVGNLPRQEAQVEEDDDEIDVAPSSESGIDNVLAHEGLQSYTPKDLQNFSPMSFRQQQQQEAPKPREETPSPAKQPDPDDIAITYADSGDYFSSAGTDSAALLF